MNTTGSGIGIEGMGEGDASLTFEMMLIFYRMENTRNKYAKMEGTSNMEYK